MFIKPIGMDLSRKKNPDHDIFEIISKCSWVSATRGETGAI